MAQADDRGAITLLGRADDIMNAGGFRVAPPEIEDHLATHPHAGDVAVAELPTAPGVSIVAAFWTGAATPDQMQALAEAGLARYKQPARGSRWTRCRARPPARSTAAPCARRIARTDHDPPGHLRRSRLPWCLIGKVELDRALESRPIIPSRSPGTRSA